jgi:mRNA-degrading endonuclease RelE of RelBE toxin-antitoxin system
MHWRVIFVETPTFTRRVLDLLEDDEYRELQAHLAEQPGIGNVIPGSGGMRKLRWAGSGRGKRGGLRVIYYWWVAVDRISMLFIYRKNERDDLTPEQVKLLRRALGL